MKKNPFLFINKNLMLCIPNHEFCSLFIAILLSGKICNYLNSCKNVCVDLIPYHFFPRHLSYDYILQYNMNVFMENSFGSIHSTPYTT